MRRRRRRKKNNEEDEEEDRKKNEITLASVTKYSAMTEFSAIWRSMMCTSVCFVHDFRAILDILGLASAKFAPGFTKACLISGSGILCTTLRTWKPLRLSSALLRAFSLRPNPVAMYIQLPPRSIAKMIGVGGLRAAK